MCFSLFFVLCCTKKVISFGNKMFIGFHFSKYLLFVMIVWGSLVVVVDGGVAFSMFKHKTQKKN